VFLIIIGGIYSIFNYKYDQIEKSIYEAELRKANEVKQKEKLEYEAEQRRILQEEADQNTKLQYELMCQNIIENSDYYESFSRRFLTDFEKCIYFENSPLDYSYWLYEIYDRRDHELNSDLLRDDCYIKLFKGFRFVELEYPYVITAYEYLPNSIINYYYKSYMIIYIPDEYMDEESLNTISVDFYYSNLTSIVDNLFIVRRPDYV
jgi:hypothetical protein